MNHYILLPKSDTFDLGINITDDINTFKVFNQNNMAKNLYHRSMPYLYFAKVKLLDNSKINKIQNDVLMTESLEILSIGHISELDLWSDDNFCEYVVQHYRGSIIYVVNRTDRVCMFAVKKDGMNLKYIDIQWPELCMAAVEENGMALQYVIKKTEDICMKAIEQSSCAIRFVNDPTDKMKMRAVEKDGYTIRFIKDQTEELCVAAIKNWPGAYSYFTIKTPLILEAAIEKCGSYISMTNFPTEQMILIAMKTCPYVLIIKEIRQLLTNEGFLKCVKINWQCLEFIDSQTYEMCEEAVKQNGFAYRHIKSNEHKKLLWCLALKILEEKYKLHNEFVELYKQYLKNKQEELTIEFQLNYFFSSFLLEDLKKIVKQHAEIYDEIYYKMCDYKFYIIKDFLEKYGINYSDEESYDLSVRYNEMNHEHYNLIRAFGIQSIKRYFGNAKW